ncbi:MAG: hypothetical protein J1E58_02775 [Prevotella sp.]|nr:hypothetical protein [Prevotella sp.]
MKKILLSAMALVAAMSVNAQEFGPLTAEATAALGLTGDLSPLAAGTELAKTASVTLTVANADDFKTSAGIEGITLGGTDLGSTACVQGNSNPPGAAASEGQYPEAGCVYKFTVSQDGYLYVFHKSSANKNYVVWENKLRIPYIYSAADGGAYDLEKVEGATVTVDGIISIADGFAIDQAQNIIGTEGKGAGTCVIKFPVYAGCEYDVHGTGTKMTLAGFYFDTTGDATVAAGEVTLLTAGGIGEGGETGINAVKPAESTNGVKYNLAGQQVDDTYKGVVIQNGKKSIQK